MLQGFVNFQFLGRLINSSTASSPTPRSSQAGQPLFKTHDCHFMGYSQGGIMGGAVSALSTEWTPGDPRCSRHGLRRVAAQPLGRLERVRRRCSTSSYTDPIDQQVVLQLAQLLWDRGENEGYAEHLTSNPYPGIAAKQIFIIENYGDHQVTNVSAEMLARTIGAQNHQPAFNASFFGAHAARRRADHAAVGAHAARPDASRHRPVSCCGTTARRLRPPSTCAPNGSPYGSDPHGFGRGNALLLDQITTFLVDRRDPERVRRRGVSEQHAVAPQRGPRSRSRRPGSTSR